MFFSSQIHETIETINQLKTQREFMLSFARDPQGFINDWLQSQCRDLKVSPSGPTSRCFYLLTQYQFRYRGAYTPVNVSVPDNPERCILCAFKCHTHTECLHGEISRGFSESVTVLLFCVNVQQLREKSIRDNRKRKISFSYLKSKVRGFHAFVFGLI